MDWNAFYILTLCMLETPKWVPWEKSDGPDEMQQNAAFHQGLHCLQRLKQHSGTEKMS